MTTDVLLYTTNWCPFCRRAKALLKEKGVRWKELDIEADPAHRQAMAEASGEAPCRRSSSMAPLSVAPMSYSRSMSEASSTNFSGATRLPPEEVRLGAASPRAFAG